MQECYKCDFQPAESRIDNKKLQTSVENTVKC